MGERADAMWRAAHEHLAAGAGPLARTVARHGLVTREAQADRARSLVGAIVGQQLSTAAAATIRRRVEELAGDGPLVDRLAEVDDEALRRAGLSTAKVRSVRDLCERVASGRLDLERLDALGDRSIVDALVAVRGIGPWTAQMFLIFAMCRPDVLATTDLGIQVAAGRLLGLGAKATPAQVADAARDGGWHPYASAACLHLWQSIDGPGAMDW